MRSSLSDSPRFRYSVLAFLAMSYEGPNLS